MAPEPLQLHAPDPADLAPLLELMVEFNAAEDIPFDAVAVLPSLRALLAVEQLGFVLLAETEGRALGYGVVTFGYDLEWQGRDAFVTELYVRPEGRGRGTGRRLLAALEERARDRGVRALHLVVRHENASAIALYQRTGFATIPRQLMTKRLV